MKKKGILKRFAAMALALTMLINGLPSDMLPVASANPGAEDGQVEYVGGETVAEGDFDITISKTIEAVEGKENYFDITLTAETRRHTVDTTTDVVVVLDVSNTMNYKTLDDSEVRLTAAKTAINSFLDSYSTNTNLSIRRFGLVTFNTNAQKVLDLTTLDNWYDAEKIQTGTVNKITASANDRVKFTNIEAGLQLAYNMLKDSTASYKYIILLTDGFPTTYINKSISGNVSSTSTITGYETFMSVSYPNVSSFQNLSVYPEGYFAEINSKKLCSSGVDYSNRGAQYAETVAAEIKQNGINIFSVGVALGTQGVPEYIAKFNSSSISTTDTTGMTAEQVRNGEFVIGDTMEEYKQWLRDDIAGGKLLSSSDYRYLDGDTTTTLKDDMAKILKDIEIAPVVTMREFYADDPMGNYIDFLQFFDKDGNLAGTSLSGESKEGAEDTASYDAGKDAIYWDLMNSGYERVNHDGYDWLVFSVKYRVRLENEASGFSWNTAVETNGTTTLNYKTTTEDGEEINDETVEYKVPKVEGYCGELQLKKVDQDGKPLAGVTFTLKHQGSSCSVCQGDASIADFSETTDADGNLSMTDIPSGHEYILVETVPDGYAPVHDRTVIVSYGKTYIDSISDENLLVDGKFPNGNSFTIVNDKTEPVELQLRIGKTMDGEVPKAGTFTFELTGKGEYGEELSETVTNDASGYATFGRMVFNKEGTYTYTISEVTGKDTGVIYESSQHTVTVTVTNLADKNVYQAVVTVDNGTTETYVGKEGTIELFDTKVVFANKSRETKVEAVLKATKTLENGTLQSGQFRFKVLDESGEMVRSAMNDASGQVIFEEFTYDTPGVYRYQIVEEGVSTDGKIIYDASVYDVVVTVSAPEDLTSDAPYRVSVQYYKNETEVTEASFTNKVRQPASLTIQGTKTMNGAVPKAGAYTFELVQVDDTGKETVLETVTNDANGTITFRELTYDSIQAKTTRISESYTYIVREVIPENADSDVAYDTTEYKLYVIADDSNTDSYYLTVYLFNGENLVGKTEGTHVTIGLGSLPISFANTSKAELVLSGQKTLDGEAPGEYSFTFVLHDEAGNHIQEVTSDADGKISFKAITYTAEDVGEHIYYIHEDSANREPEIHYDETVYIVKVNVSMDAQGNLSVSHVITKNGAEVDAITFDNKTIDPTHLHLTAEKTVNGGIPSANQIFTFGFKLISAPEGVEITDIDNYEQSITNNGKFVVFEHLTLQVPGTYQIKITETIPAAATEENGYTVDGMTYDTTEYLVTVVVTKTEAGELEQSIEIQKDDVKVDSLTFNNTYKTEPVKVTLEGTKELTGRDLKAGEFSFTLTGEDQNQTKTNDADGNFQFDAMEYSTPGTYHYTVRESAGNLGGVTYDQKVYDVTVVVTDNGKGKLEATVTVDGTKYTEETLAFINSYKPEPGHVYFTATKTLTGRNLQAKEFTFVLTDVTNPEKPVQLQKVTNGATYGSHVSDIWFSPIPFTEEGTYKYEISEVASDEVNGITYDATIKEITVVVKDDGNGNLITYIDEEDVSDYYVGEFKNEYKTEPVEVTFQGTKVLTGRELKDGEFTFVLKDSAGHIVTWKDSQGNTIDSVTNQGEKFVFPAIQYTAAGTHSYTIEEVVPADQGKEAGITYDTTVKQITVVVSDNGDGKLIAKVHDQVVTGNVEVGTFTNKYKADPDELALEARKELAGRDLKAEEFTFVLKNKDGEVVQTKKNDANGKVVFDAISYDEAGTYEYTVSEEKGSLGGVTYTDTIYTVIVTVTDDGKGQLKASATVNNDQPYDSKNTQIVFQNEYKPAPVKVELEAKKTLTGRDLKAGEFTFTLIGDGQNQSKTNAADGKVKFDTITYTEEGTYEYTVTEVAGSLGGVIYANNIYTVTVKVTDNGEGQLMADVRVDGAAYNSEETQIQFVNDYEAKPASIQVKAKKTLEGADLVAGKFSFCLAKDGDHENHTSIQTVSNDADGNVVFEKLTFTEAGEYHYCIHEINGGLTKDGIDYSASRYNFTVVVTDDSKGQLVATINGETEMVYLGEFVNVYDPEVAHVTLRARKQLDGKDLDGGEFTFVLEEKMADGSWEKISEAENENLDGIITFDPLTFDQEHEGTHIYRVREIKGDQKGVTYDETVYTVEIVVWDDDEGVIRTKVTIKDAEGKVIDENYNPEQSSMLFVNKYKPEGTEITLDAYKELTGRTGKALQAGEFTFELLDSEGKVLQTRGNGADGTILFDAIQYDEAGTYTYTMREVIPEEDSVAGVTYDSTVYMVVVTVTDDGKGQLHAAATVDGAAYAEKAEEQRKFTNSYKADPTEIVLKATKTLTGKDLQAGDFTFELKDADGQVLQTVTNGAIGEGNVIFEAITYEKTGTYTYTVSEVKGSEKGILYDETIYTVIVVVTDSGDGKLEATVDGVEVAETNAGIFANKYEPAPAKISLEATKNLTGRKLAEGEFTFVLTNVTNGEAPVVVEKVTNAADGTVIFSEIQYTEVGEHHYTVTEEKGELGGITYDETVYNVTVVVTDEGGQLKASVTVNGQAYDAGNPIYFTNRYHAAPAKLTLTANKELAGRELRGGEFQFQLLNSQGGLVREAVNAADGTVTFEELTFNVVGSHTFTVVEVSGELSGVTYDQTIYTVVITVTDNGQGQLVTEVVVNGANVLPDDTQDGQDEIVFNNTYKPAPVALYLEGSKLLQDVDGNAMVLEEGKFTFHLADSDHNLIEEVTNGADGKIVFSPILYTEAGTYSYIIHEYGGGLNQAGIDYDSTTIYITVEVTDDENGQLVLSVKEETVMGETIREENLTLTDKTAADGTMVKAGEFHIGTFTNVYDPDEAHVELRAHKTLTGRELKEEEFTFVLTDITDAENPVVLQIVKNAADGTVIFDKLTFHKADVGTHTYTISEVKEDLTGVTYDTTVYTVKIEVIDNQEEGVIETIVTVEGIEEAYNPELTSIVFQNTYAPIPVEVVLKAGKELTGRTLKAGEFTFELLNDEKQVIATAKNDANGNIVFTITIEEAGLHTFYMREVEGSDSHIKYDTTEHPVLVTVEENDACHLEVTNIHYGKQNVEKIVFQNKYTPDEPSKTPEKPTTPSTTAPDTGDSSPIGLYAGLAGISAVALLAVFVVRKKRKEEEA